MARPRVKTTARATPARPAKSALAPNRHHPPAIWSTADASVDATWSLGPRHFIEASTRTGRAAPAASDPSPLGSGAIRTKMSGSGSPPELTETECETSRSVPTQRRNSTLSAPAEARRPCEGRRTTTTPCEARPSCPATASIPTTRRTAGSDGKATGEDAPHVRRPRDQPCQLRTRTARSAGDPRRVSGPGTVPVSDLHSVARSGSGPVAGHGARAPHGVVIVRRRGRRAHRVDNGSCTPSQKGVRASGTSAIASMLSSTSVASSTPPGRSPPVISSTRRHGPGRVASAAPDLSPTDQAAFQTQMSFMYHTTCARFQPHDASSQKYRRY